MCNTAKKQVNKAKVISNKKVCDEHFIIEIEDAYLGQNSLPGQFVNVKVTEKSYDPLLRIPLGIHSIDEKGIQLLYKVVGEGTQILSEKMPGDDINILGPLGNTFNPELAGEKGYKSFIVAGGHGIAPLYALCEDLVKRNASVEFFIGVNTKAHLTSIERLGKLGVKVHIASVDGSVGAKGNVTKLLEKEISVMKNEKKKGVIFSCGPRQMLKEVARIAQKEKVSTQVSLDAYMACGIGVCLGCAIKTIDGFKLVCKDGPVFNAKDIVWDEIN